MDKIFCRQPARYSEERFTVPGGAINTVLCRKRRQIEEDIEGTVRRRMQERGDIKDRSIFLERRSEKCFFGCTLLDHLTQELPDLDKRQIMELSESLYREQYIVPVMKFVNSITNTTVLYRYSKDERQVQPKLAQERRSSLELVRSIIEKRRIGPAYIAGNKLLELLDKSEVRDVIMPADCRQHASKDEYYRQCQRMLVHGFLVPAVCTHNERYQKFRAECSYCLCDTKQKQERIKEEQENVVKEAPAITTAPRFSTLSNRSVVNIRVIPHKKETSTSLRRSFRRQRRNSVVWTMEFRTQQSRPRTESSVSVASDVEVIDNTAEVLTYTPPLRKRDRIKRGYRKLLRLGAKSSDVWLKKQSCMEEWSVY